MIYKNRYDLTTFLMVFQNYACVLTYTELSFLRIESGVGKAVLNSMAYEISEDMAIVVPAGTKHNFINTSTDKPLKLYTIYAPPEHRDGTVHETKEEAKADKEDHFQG